MIQPFLYIIYTIRWIIMVVFIFPEECVPIMQCLVDLHSTNKARQI